MGANLALASKVKKKLAAAVVQLDGSVFIWHMIDWFSTACCLYGARSKSEGRSYKSLHATKHRNAPRSPYRQPPAASSRQPPAASAASRQG
jgi:hypothetical protein